MRSSDESSEEDFYFLEKALKESNELDEVDRRLLVGIVQAPPKELKRWDKEDPAEMRRRRKQRALENGEHWSDSYDDETDGDVDDDGTMMGEYGTNGKDGSVVDLLGGGATDGKSMLHKVQQARNRALGKGMAGEGGGEIVLPCPDGYDPLKWATLSRKEKMKVLGITEAEWN